MASTTIGDDRSIFRVVGRGAHSARGRKRPSASIAQGVRTGDVCIEPASMRRERLGCRLLPQVTPSAPPRSSGRSVPTYGSSRETRSVLLPNPRASLATRARWLRASTGYPLQARPLRPDVPGPEPIARRRHHNGGDESRADAPVPGFAECVLHISFPIQEWPSETAHDQGQHDLFLVAPQQISVLCSKTWFRIEHAAHSGLLRRNLALPHSAIAHHSSVWD